MRISTEELRKAFDVIDVVTANKAMLSSQFVRVQPTKRGLLFNLTGLAVGEAVVPSSAVVVQHDGPLKKDVCIDRRLLAGFLAAHPRAEAIRWTNSDEKITLQASTHKLDLSLVESTGYSAWAAKGKKRAKLAKDDVQKLALLGQFVSGAGSVMEHLTSVCLVPKYGALATDSLVLAAVLDNKMQLQGFLPPLLPLSSDDCEIVFENDGVGAVFNAGYVYQPIDVSCLKGFPLSAMREILDGLTASKPLLSIKLALFKDIVQQLLSLVFGETKQEAAPIECVGSATKKIVTVRLPLKQGLTQRSFRYKVPKDFQLLWPAERLAQWLRSLPSDIDNVDCYKIPIGVGFCAAHDSATYALVASEVSA